MAEFTLLPRTSIEALTGVIDGFPRTDHELLVSKTSHPVEGGGSVTDHATVQPTRLSLTGFVGDLSAVDRSASAWERVESLLREREPVTVVTSWRVYNRMVLLRAHTSRGRDVGKALVFTLDLEELQVVGLDTTEVDGPATDRPPLQQRGLRPLQPSVSSLQAVNTPMGRRGLEGALERAAGITTAVRNQVRTGLRSANRLESVLGTAVSGNTRRQIRAAIDNVPGLSDSERSSLRRALTDVLDISASTNQTFRTVAGGESRTMRIFRQPTDGGWYMNVEGLTTGARLQPNQMVGGSSFRVLPPTGSEGNELPADPWAEGYEIGWEGD